MQQFEIILMNGVAVKGGNWDASGPADWIAQHDPAYGVCHAL